MTDLDRSQNRTENAAKPTASESNGEITDVTDVAIIGAGPYGLSLAAHLNARGVPFRQFGRPMEMWETGMPRGMLLKSQGFATNLSAPDGHHTLREFCGSSGREYADTRTPVPLRTFLEYGHWFRREVVPGPCEAPVRRLTWRAGGDPGYRLALTDGSAVLAKRVVIATGLTNFAFVPQTLATLPPTLCSHTSTLPPLTTFRGQKIVVVGAGQSGLETAVLLAERGIDVTLACRESSLIWNDDPLPVRRTRLARLREPEVGLGSGWTTWFYSERPYWFHRLPAPIRANRAVNALGPAGAWWLHDRYRGRVPTLLGHIVVWATPRGDGVTLTLAHAGGTREIEADHVIAATGYRTDFSKLSFVDERLRSRVRTLAGGPVLGRDFQSTVPGLYFAGPMTAASFGPVMRFVYGAKYAAPALAGHLAEASV